MTFRDKIEAESPEDIDLNCLGGIFGCPYAHGYESIDESPCRREHKKVNDQTCCECWDREIPGTEPLTYEHTGEHIGKVIDITEDENSVTAKIEIDIKEEKTMATKKTKAELEKELETVKASKAELEKELKNLEKYKEYEDMAGEIHALYTSFVTAGFSEEQAYDLLKTMIQNAGNLVHLNSNKSSYVRYGSYR